MKKIIPIQEVIFSSLSVNDDIGRVFEWNNEIFRAIYTEKTTWVEKLWQCGLMDELTDKGLIPKTKITDYSLEGYGIILQHEKIPIVTYPYEWTFSMLQQAALLILEINTTAQKYQFQTKDAHPYNVLFDGTKPLWVDLGSIVPLENGEKFWAGFEEFLRTYYYPLQIAAKNEYYFAKKSLLGNDFLTHQGYLLYKYPILRSIGLTFVEKNITRFYKFCKISSVKEDKVKGKLPDFLANILLSCAKNGLLPFQKTNFRKWKKKISSLHFSERKTSWGEYHSQFYGKDKQLNSTPRFDRIIELLKIYPIKDVVEVAGNQGIFAQLMLDRLHYERIICTDYDDKAVDKMFLYGQKSIFAKKIYPVLLNFFYPSLTSFTKPPVERFQADLLVALALTHHLVLTQRISLDSIFSTCAQYTRAYIAIEFMPLGLYGGTFIPEVPTWYTQEWFKTHFQKYFDVLHIEKLEDNRVLFIGKKINA